MGKFALNVGKLELKVEANFCGNLEKLDKHVEMFETVQTIDTSETEYLVIATFTNGIVHSSIEEEDILKWFTQIFQT